MSVPDRPEPSSAVRPPDAALAAFGAKDDPVPLPGGKGGTWRAGHLVLKPVEFLVETVWRAEVLDGLPDVTAFRVARPARTGDGAWVAQGWEATHLVAGEPDVSRQDDVLRAGIAFHAAIADVPRPAFLDLRDDPWSYGDRVAWGELPVRASPAAMDLLRPLVQARRRVNLVSQVVHGDLPGNVMFADGLPPAIIDWPAYWRPTSWASAVAVADALCWYDAQPDLLVRWSHLPEWGQMLIRALIYRIITHDKAFGPTGWTPDQASAYRPAIDLAVKRDSPHRGDVPDHREGMSGARQGRGWPGLDGGRMTNNSTIPHRLPTERDAGPFDPPREITRLRETRPVSPMVFPDGHEGWIVTGYDEVRQLMADTRFSSRQDIGILHEPYETPGMPGQTEPSPPAPGLFISMDPPDHSRLRKKLTGAFTVKRMRQLEERIVEIAERQLDELARLAPPVDLVAEFALPVPSLVICELLGVHYADRETFQANSTKFLDRDLPIDEKIIVVGALNTYLSELVTRKRADPGDDILSDLARHDDLTIEELTGIAFLLLLAGHETTANMLALGTFALLENPEQAAELRANPDLMPGAVEELLRYLSITDIFFRYATEDIELGGETIDEGSTVIVSLLAANRDPQRFEDPDILDIHRKARGHLSFGHGVHQCLGQQLARIEMRAGFAGLLRRFPTLELAVPAGEVKLRTTMRIYGVHELPVTWTRTAR